MKPLNDYTPWPKFSVYDIEAEDWTRVTCLCHVDEYKNRKLFDSVAAYLDWLYSSEFRGDLVWAHGGGFYDQRFIIWEASLRNWHWQAMVSGNLIIILVLRDGNGREIKFCESLRIMPDSVEKIGKTVGLPKLDVDRSKIGSYTRAQVVEYCFRDCDIVMRGLVEMRKVLMGAGCDFAFTLASIATRYIRRSKSLNAWKFYKKTRNMEGQTRLIYDPAVLEADAWCLPAYFGGRVEVFRKGLHRDLFYYDVTSSYPWSMTHDLPSYFLDIDVPRSGMRSFGGGVARAVNISKTLARCGISDATVTMPNDPKRFYAPVLPIRNAKATKVEYRILQGVRGKWTNIELLKLWEQGREHGVKIDIHAQANYAPNPFMADFVEKFFGLRLEAIAEGDAFKSYAFKIIQNSAYGKLIETTVRRSVLYGDMVDEARERFGDEHVVPSPTPGAYFLKTESDGPFRHVAAGAYVTARSRLKLLEGIETALAAGAKVYYCDTDSLIVDKPVFGMSAEKTLGNWNLEAQIAEAEIFSSKVYKFTDVGGNITYRAKGMPIKGLTPHASELRWQMFTAQLRGTDAEKPEKQGLNGFLTDLRKGTLQPNAHSLFRQMKNGDSKRSHLDDGDSEPQIWTAESA